MASPPLKSVLQKPPGYRDPNAPHLPRPKPPAYRKPVLPVSLRPRKQRRRCRRRCCCVFCIFLLILLVAVVVAAALIYLVYDPLPPVFHLQSFRIPKLKVSENPDGGAYLDAGTVTRVEVKNPNSKIAWYFGETRLAISTDDGNLNLGSKTLPGFTIDAKEMTILKAETSLRGQVLEEREGKNVKEKFRRREFVPSVEVRTRAGVGVQGLKIGSVGITVVCGEVTLKKLEDGEMPKCTITLLKWIKIQ